MDYGGAAEAAQVEPPQADGVGAEGAVPMDAQAAQQHLEQQHQHLAAQHHLTPEQLQVALQDPSLMQGLVHIDPSAMVGLPPGLPPVQPAPDSGAGSGGKFKPIDLESLSPKSKQRVLRNRQAATRSKAKKKEQFQMLKDKKQALQGELEQLEALVVATQQRVHHLSAENKALADNCKCGKE